MGNIVHGFMFQPPPVGSYVGDVAPFYRVDGVPFFFHNVPNRQAILIYLHGNATDIGETRPLMEELALKTRCSVVAVEYPGYGAHRKTSATPGGCTEALVKVYRWLARTAPEVPRVILGHSIGTGVALDAMRHLTDTPPRALVLLSPFRSIGHMADRLVGIDGVRALVSAYNNEKAIRGVRVPTLIFHGALDPLIPLDHSRQLYSASPAVKKHLSVLPRSTHNELEWERIHAVLNRFIEDVIQ